MTTTPEYLKSEKKIQLGSVGRLLACIRERCFPDRVLARVERMQEWFGPFY